MSDAAALSDALAYAERYGFHVYPVHTLTDAGACTCGKGDCTSPGKHPRTEHGKNDATTDPATVRAWWTKWPAAQVGANTGASGIVVLDVDVHGETDGRDAWAALVAEHPALENAPMAETPNDGLHAFYRADGDRIGLPPGTPLGAGIEVLGEGGAVILPSAASPARDWVPGLELGTAPLAPLPRPVAARVTYTTRPRDARREKATGKRPAGEVEKPAKVAEGGRHAYLLSLAGTMRAAGYGEAVIATALQAVNRGHTTTPHSERHVADLAASVAKYPPDYLPETSAATRAAAIATAAEDGPPKPAPTPTLYPLTDPDGEPGPALAALWAAEAEAARAARLSGRPRGPVTGFPTLDLYLGGYLRPGLHFIHGEPGTGKTNFGLQVAATCGAPALLVSCEMSPIALVRRIVARTTDTFEGDLDDGEKSPAALAELFAYAAGACPMLALMDATRAYATAAAIRLAAEDLRAAHVNAGGRVLVVLDSLHTWAGADPGNGDASEYESLNRALGRLQGLAAALEAPVLVVAERNRPSMASAGQSAAKGTARIEYCAESIVSLNRVLDSTGEWEHDSRGEYPLFAKVAKNRAGRTGPRVQLRFNGALARLREA